MSKNQSIKKYYIYKITNNITNKIYIGRTTQTIEKRWSVHKSHSKYWKKYFKNKNKSYFLKSLNFYGAENFDIKHLELRKIIRFVRESGTRSSEPFEVTHWTRPNHV